MIIDSLKRQENKREHINRKKIKIKSKKQKKSKKIDKNRKILFVLSTVKCLRTLRATITAL